MYTFIHITIECMKYEECAERVLLKDTPWLFAEIIDSL